MNGKCKTPDEDGVVDLFELKPFNYRAWYIEAFFEKNRVLCLFGYFIKIFPLI